MRRIVIRDQKYISDSCDIDRRLTSSSETQTMSLRNSIRSLLHILTAIAKHLPVMLSPANGVVECA